MATNISPTYSHGGAGAGGFPAVPGTTQSSGRPIFIGDAVSQTNQILPGLIAFFVGTTVTFVVEGNGGLIDPTGNPPSAEWIDVTNGGITLTTGQSIGKTLPIQFPVYRTRITAITLGGGSGLVSYVPSIITAGGVQASARYPKLSSSQSLY
jgi:hypothetical protein